MFDVHERNETRALCKVRLTRMRNPCSPDLSASESEVRGMGTGDPQQFDDLQLSSRRDADGLQTQGAPRAVKT